MAKKKVKKRVLTRIDADQLEAGDTLVLRIGGIRRFYHICELQIKHGNVHVIYNIEGGFGHIDFDPDDRVVVREWL